MPLFIMSFQNNGWTGIWIYKYGMVSSSRPLLLGGYFDSSKTILFNYSDLFLFILISSNLALFILV